MVSFYGETDNLSSSEFFMKMFTAPDNIKQQAVNMSKHVRFIFMIELKIQSWRGQ